MIAFDTSVIVDYFKQVDNEQTAFLNHQLINGGVVILPPIVITELFSEPKQLTSKAKGLINNFAELDIMPDYWERAGTLRAKLRAKKLKANTADALIAQFCIDHDIPLITSDSDFNHYAKYGGLKLL